MKSILSIALVWSVAAAASDEPSTAKLLTFAQLNELSSVAQTQYLEETADLLVALERVGGRKNAKIYARSIDGLLPLLIGEATAQNAPNSPACPPGKISYGGKCGDDVECGLDDRSWKRCCHGAEPAHVIGVSTDGKTAHAFCAAATAVGAPTVSDGCLPFACRGTEKPRSRDVRKESPLCINAGMALDFDAKGDFCPSVREFGSGGLKCERNETMCNPLIFGVASDDKAVCVPIGARTTLGCVWKTRAHRGKASPFKKWDSGGAEEAWDQLREKLGKICGAGKTAEYHCAECRLIASALAHSNRAYKNIDACGRAEDVDHGGRAGRRSGVAQ